MKLRLGRTAAVLLSVFLLALPARPAPAQEAGEPWSAERANEWYREQGWLVGSNFSPASAINQLEMWQADTFDPAGIDRELAWAESLGFNTMRVFLHDLLWKQDPQGFLDRIDRFLAISQRHGIRPMLVLFDGVWDPFPRLGRQRAPKPHLHNSGWVQSPGVDILSDPARHDEMEGYVKGVVGRFRDDPRVLAWDIFNEPDNINHPAYFVYEPENKAELALMLLRKAYGWAREMRPTQPITTAPWRGEWVDPQNMPELTRFMLEESDIITFHSYDPADRVREQIEALKRYGRPILITEYMARPRGSTFETLLPLLKEHDVGAYNWGFVSGKSQTIYPWDSWRTRYTREPDLWFHDIFRADGTPYRQAEVDLIRSLTGRR